MDKNILERIQKLLALGTSANEHEAANALGLATKLMEKHSITEAMLPVGKPEEEIRNWEDALWKGKQRRSQWRIALAGSLAHASYCEVYTWGSEIRIIGRANDVQTVRYLFMYCEQEIERLSKQYAGNGKGWLMNYKLGCTLAIKNKMDEAQEETRKEMVNQHGKNAVNAIIRLDQKGVATKNWASDYFVQGNFRTRGFGQQSYYGDARSLGYSDGQKINLGNNNSGLNGGPKGLPG